MTNKGNHVVRRRTKRHNIGSRAVEDVAKFMQQMMRRMDGFELARRRRKFIVKVIQKNEYTEDNV